MKHTANLSEHPTVQVVRERPRREPAPLDRGALRDLALDAGADDVGVVSVNRPEIERVNSGTFSPCFLAQIGRAHV